MPFTPIHFGPGATIKAVIPRHFSFAVFCFAQVLMDIEVIIYMARGGERLHGAMHTYLGAAAVAILSFLIGRPICERILRWWLEKRGLPLKEYFHPAPRITFIAAGSGALLGGFSHVFLDSLMHGDVQPSLPFDEKAHPFGRVEAGTLHLVCFVLVVLGAIVCGSYRRSVLCG